MGPARTARVKEQGTATSPAVEVKEIQAQSCPLRASGKTSPAAAA